MKEPKSWWMSLVKAPSVPKGKKTEVLGSVELNGGETDAGLMESDLQYLFEILLENTHPDLSDKDIGAAWRRAREGI